MKNKLIPFLTLVLIISCGGGGGGTSFKLSANSSSISTNEDTAISGRVSATANKPTEISYSFLSQPSNGRLETMSDGSYTYLPNRNFFGSDSFTFSATSSEYNSTETGTISITVIGIDDLPALRTNEYFIDENTTLIGALDIVDEEGDPFVISIADERPNIFKATSQLGNEDGSPYVIDQDYTVSSDQVVELISDLQIKGGATFTLEPGAKLIAKDTYENGDYKWCDRNVTSDGDKEYSVSTKSSNTLINLMSCYWWNLKHIHMYEGNFIAKGNAADKVYIRNIAFMLAKEGGKQGYQYFGRRDEVKRKINFDHVDMAGGFIIPHGYSGSSDEIRADWDGYTNINVIIKNSFLYKTNNRQYFYIDAGLNQGDFIFSNNIYVGNGGFRVQFKEQAAQDVSKGDDFTHYFYLKNNLIAADDNRYWGPNYSEELGKGRFYIADSYNYYSTDFLQSNAYDFIRQSDSQGNQIFEFNNNILTRFPDDVPAIHCNPITLSDPYRYWYMTPIGSNYFGYNTLNDFWDSSLNIQNLEACKLYDSEQYFLSKSPQEFSYTPRIYLAEDLNPASDGDEKKMYFDFPVDYEALKNKSFEYKVNITYESNTSGTPDVTETFVVKINDSD